MPVEEGKQERDDDISKSSKMKVSRVDADVTVWFLNWRCHVTNVQEVETTPVKCDVIKCIHAINTTSVMLTK